MYYWDPTQNRVRRTGNKTARITFDDVHFIEVQAFEDANDALLEGAAVMEKQAKKLLLRVRAIRKVLDK